MDAMRICRGLLLALLLTGLTACKEVLHTGLSEDDCNAMVALLLSRDIDAEKIAGDKGVFSLMVASADFAAAIEILRDHGYPRDDFSDLGTVFDNQGLISSPLEEHARFTYAVSQSISETLSQIDGVVKARVHVSMPEAKPLETDPPAATASVFLKTRPGINLDNKISQIKMIVHRSVEGLKYEDVSVALFEASPLPNSNRVDGPALSEFLGIRYTSDSFVSLIIVVGIFCLLLIAALGGNAYLLTENRRLQQRRAGNGNNDRHSRPPAGQRDGE